MNSMCSLITAFASVDNSTVPYTSDKEVNCSDH